MKVNYDARMEEALASGVPFDTQLVEAKASGKRFAIVTHVTRGPSVVYETPEEAVEAARVKSVERTKPWLARIEALEKMVEDLVKAKI